MAEIGKNIFIFGTFCPDRKQWRLKQSGAAAAMYWKLRKSAANLTAQESCLMAMVSVVSANSIC
jgi:hypothetical protein